MTTHLFAQRRRWLISLLLLLFTSLSTAVVKAQQYDLGRYLQAKQALRSGAALDEFNDLADHPLYPYLAATHYQKNLDLDQQIADLSLHFFHAKPVKDLIDAWVEQKFNLGQYDTLTTHYFDTGKHKTECLYRQAQLNLGQRDKAFEDIEGLWASVKSLPDECDSVLFAWSGSANPEKRFTRAKKAYFADNFTLTRYLLNDAADNEAQVLRAFAELALNPDELYSITPDAYAQATANHAYLPNALAELARKDSVANANFILQFAPYLADNSDYQTLLNTLTRYLEKRDSALCLNTFSRIAPEFVEKDTEEAVVRYLINAYRSQDITTFMPTPQFSMGQYWLGKTLAQKGDVDTAKTWWQKAAQTRSYYGFLAAERIGQPYAFNLVATDINATQQSNFSKNNNLIRAQLLRRIADHTNARREILQIYEKLATSDVPQLAVWLNDNGFYFESIYVFGKIRQWNDVKRRFPMPFNAEVRAGAINSDVPEDWIYAIIRQESTMNRYAVSRARAKGLMQLIPSTARSMARKVGVSAGDIFDSGANVLMGSQYLHDMHNRFGNSVLASAAYNAGPGRVDQWTENGIDDIEAWIERIPFKETRKYVKNIIEYRIVYQDLLGKKGQTVKEILAEGLLSAYSSNNL